MIDLIIGFSGVILMNASALPQIYKVYKTHSVKDMDIRREWLLLLGCTLYLIHGIMRGNPVIIVSNVWAMIMFILLLYMMRRWKCQNTDTTDNLNWLNKTFKTKITS